DRCGLIFASQHQTPLAILWDILHICGIVKPPRSRQDGSKRAVSPLQRASCGAAGEWFVGKQIPEHAECGDRGMSRILSLGLLGPFQVEDPPGLGFLTRKIEALTAFLALRAGRLHSRGELAALLWGSRDETHARHSLRQALTSLRKTLAQANIDVLIADGDRIG